MSEHIEKRTVLQDIPFASRPVIVKDINERKGISGVAIAALVVAAMTAAALVTMLIINSQQKASNEELARERASAVAAQPAPAQPAPQQPLIVMPQSQPAIVTAPSPASAPSTAPKTEPGIAPSNAGLEIEVTSRLQNDEELQRYAVFVMVTHGTATLSGQVPNEDLKKRAEKLAGNVTGIRSVINEIGVKP